MNGNTEEMIKKIVKELETENPELVDFILRMIISIKKKKKG